MTGGFSSGKSTQRRNLCVALADKKPKICVGQDNGVNYFYTNFGVISAVGKVKQQVNEAISTCDGLDSVFSFVKKVGGVYTVDKALQASKVVVLEGSQTSPVWAEMLQPILKRHKAKLYLVHLSLSYWDNFLRMSQRQESKGKLLAGGLTDKNIESIIGKNRQFNNCYDKCDGLAERIQITPAHPNGEFKTDNEIFDEILQFCFND